MSASLYTIDMGKVWRKVAKLSKTGKWIVDGGRRHTFPLCAIGLLLEEDTDV